MTFFKKLKNATAIVQSGGVYREADLAYRPEGDGTGGRLYARFGSGYVRMNAGGTTSKQSVKWVEIDAPDHEWIESGVAVTLVGDKA